MLNGLQDHAALETVPAAAVQGAAAVAAQLRAGSAEVAAGRRIRGQDPPPAVEDDDRHIQKVEDLLGLRLERVAPAALFLPLQQGLDDLRNHFEQPQLPGGELLLRRPLDSEVSPEPAADPQRLLDQLMLAGQVEVSGIFLLPRHGFVEFSPDAVKHAPGFEFGENGLEMFGAETLPLPRGDRGAAAGPVVADDRPGVFAVAGILEDGAVVGIHLRRQRRQNLPDRRSRIAVQQQVPEGFVDDPVLLDVFVEPEVGLAEIPLLGQFAGEVDDAFEHILHLAFGVEDRLRGNPQRPLPGDAVRRCRPAGSQALPERAVGGGAAFEGR